MDKISIKQFLDKLDFDQLKEDNSYNKLYLLDCNARLVRALLRLKKVIDEAILNKRKAISISIDTNHAKDSF